MIFRSGKKRARSSARSMDRLITGIIIGGAAASIFGVSRTKKGKKIWAKIGFHGKKYAEVGLRLFGKNMVRAIEFLQNNQK